MKILICVALIFLQVFAIAIAIANAGGAVESAEPTNEIKLSDKQVFGKQLFNDPALSRDGGQSCATCHNPSYAFADSRINVTSIGKAPAPISLGQDNKSLGDINTPSLTYAALVPKFHFDKKEDVYVGGLFLNGRADDLHAQALGPVLNPVEMQSSEQHIIDVVKRQYAQSMKALYGQQVLDDDKAILDALAQSIVAYERSVEFVSFDSKFDRVMQGKASFTEQEKLGKELFIDKEKGACAECHIVPEQDSTKAQSVFSDFTYDNLGTPKNKLARAHNGHAADYVDLGLLSRPDVEDKALAGAFRVPSLRNVAVTAPYMHNGVFSKLSTVLQFYNKRDVDGALNPETGKPWQKGEVEKTKNTQELGDLGLTDDELAALQAFLKTLTDQRYEHLLK